MPMSSALFLGDVYLVFALLEAFIRYYNDFALRRHRRLHQYILCLLFTQLMLLEIGIDVRQ